ncbi:PspC domain [Bifidobacterium hapali]|uniref:PspC domain n=1 Tax=Bifidobacterium hapali TaxID=1630172 RepID=A0A261G1R8_9BIFI|nr:PspC domain-containing protein [Bifidobacterium hapali]OZG65371.1 PspC domain [Bifidobacterium hapali]
MSNTYDGYNSSERPHDGRDSGHDRSNVNNARTTNGTSNINNAQPPYGPPPTGTPFSYVPPASAYRQESAQYQRFQRGQSQPEPQSAPAQRSQWNSTGAGFFAWIRRSGITRSDDRWVGGVCGGLARYFGISATLMRAIMVGAVLLGGFGAALYAFAWLLLPDDRNGTILCERLIVGDWDWSCLGIALCFVIGVGLPGAGWLATIAAAFVMWLLIERELRRQRGYGTSTSDAGYRRGNSPYDNRNSESYSGPYNAATTAPTAAAGQSTWTNPQPVSQQYPNMRDTQPPTGPQSYAAAGASTASDMPSMSTPASAQPSPSASSFVSATSSSTTTPLYSTPASPFAATQSATQSTLARRKPAGPLVVTVVIGLIFIFAAVALLQTNGHSLVSIIQSSTLWIGATCVLVGLVILVLGVRGRRAGGLVPVAWIAAITALAVLTVNLTYNYLEMRYADLYRSYTTTNVSGTVTYDDIVGSSSSSGDLDGDSPTYARLSDGVIFTGTDFDNDRVLVDLSDYARRPKHIVDLINGNRVRTNCPTGTLHVAASNTQVILTLPTGCPFAFGTGAANSSSGVNVYGGRYAVMGSNGSDSFGIGGTFSRNVSADGTRNGHYVTVTNPEFSANGADSPAWARDYDYWPADGSELLIDVPYLLSAQVFVRYPATETGDNAALFGEHAE